jgi:hypothetical protein
MLYSGIRGERASVWSNWTCEISQGTLRAHAAEVHRIPFVHLDRPRLREFHVRRHDPIRPLAGLDRLPARSCEFSRGCSEEHFATAAIYPGAVSAIIDAFQRTGRNIIGRYLFSGTGAFWDKNVSWMG